MTGVLVKGKCTYDVNNMVYLVRQVQIQRTQVAIFNSDMQTRISQKITILTIFTPKETVHPKNENAIVGNYYYK